MRERSGAGASVSSGASYQARVGAYVIASRVCESENLITGPAIVEQISFETTQEVDDINVTTDKGSIIYIQAKATIFYSLMTDGELRSVLKQFEAQNTAQKDKLVLITSSRSSKKIIFDLRTALEAFRTSPDEVFYRDQPRALTNIISELRATLNELRAKAGKPNSAGTVDDILRQMSVIVLDVEATDPLEQALILLMASKGYGAAEAVWGKLVADCVGYARSRRTIRAADIETQYKRFCSTEPEKVADSVESFFEIEFRGEGASAGRDLLLCDLPAPIDTLPAGLSIVETYRFDTNCSERLVYEDNSVVFAGHLKVPFLRRTATYEGMTRLIEQNPALVGDRTLNICPINSDEDFESGNCVAIHRHRLQKAAEKNPRPLHCLRCGKAVFSAFASMIELPPLEDPVVGLCHDQCLRPADRVIGTVQSDFFCTYPELVSFDAEAWYKSAHGGQIVFENAKTALGGKHVYIAWGGNKPRGPEGTYVVEVALQGGGREVVTKRNSVHRFSKPDAEVFASQLNSQVERAQRAGDPLCYTDQSKAFATRSQLLQILGSREKITPVDRVRARPYEARFAARFSRPGQWYAPLLYLRDRKSGEPIVSHNTVFMITDPLKLKIFLENWNQVNICVVDYETELILTDEDFDDFMRWCDVQGYSVVIDPLFDPATVEIVSGYPVRSVESVVEGRQV